MIGMPLQKPREYIDTYLTLGPHFGNIIINLLNEFISLNIPTTYILINKYKELCDSTFPDYKISYPFVTQTNEYDNNFGQEICVSVNSCIAHGRLPINQNFELGSIISLDFGLCLEKTEDSNFKKIHFDAAITIPFEEQIISLINLLAPLRVLKNVSCLTGPICNANITELVVKESMNTNPPLGIVSSLTGHGIGYKLHESPRIYNYPVSEQPIWLPENFVFCVEPMYVLGSKEHIASTYIGEDGWSIMAHNNLISTHFETTFCYFMDNGIFRIVDVLNLVDRLDVTFKEIEDGSNKCRVQESKWQ